jgi:hypothetical protein
MTSDVNILVAQTAVRDMLRKGYISICTIDTILKLLGVAPTGEAYKQLHALHCVNFCNMPPELVSKIPGMLREVFSGMAIEVLDAPIAETKKRSSFFGKLLDA